jgi:hypothetical protein
VPAPACEGSPAEVVASQQCDFEMSLLAQEPYELVQGDPIDFVVRARNLVGWSIDSDLASELSGTIFMIDVPHKPIAPPQRNDLLTSDLQLVVTWSELLNPNDGGETVTSYNLQYRESQESLEWIDLTGVETPFTDTTFSVTSDITVGRTYEFRYRAQNSQGFGPFSEELQLVAARRTDQVTNVITSNEYTLVKITWHEPAYDGGSPLLGYRIKIKTSAGQYVESTEHCDGERADVRANLYCELHMAVLR